MILSFIELIMQTGVPCLTVSQNVTAALVPFFRRMPDKMRMLMATCTNGWCIVKVCDSGHAGNVVVI